LCTLDCFVVRDKHGYVGNEVSVKTEVKGSSILRLLKCERWIPCDSQQRTKCKFRKSIFQKATYAEKLYLRS